MSDIQEQIKLAHKKAEENDIDTYKMYRKIQEQAKVYEEYNNFDREDLIDELVEEKRINEKDLEEINRLNNIIDGLEKYINEVKNMITTRDIKENIYICGRYDENLDILDKLNELGGKNE